MKLLKSKFLVHSAVVGGLIFVLVITTLVLGSVIGRNVLEIEAMRTEITFRTKSIELLTLLRQQSEEARRYNNFLNNMLPTRDQLITFPKDIQTIGRNSGVDFSVRFGNETDPLEGRPGSISFRGSAHATLPEFIAFLSAVEQSRYFVNFQSFSMTTGGVRDAESSINVGGEVFFSS